MKEYITRKDEYLPIWQLWEVVFWRWCSDWFPQEQVFLTDDEELLDPFHCQVLRGYSPDGKY